MADGGPVFSMFFMLSAHLDEETSGEDLLVELFFDEIDGINFGFEDDFEGSRVVFFDFDELIVGEGPFNIFFDCVEIALDEVEGDVFDIIIEALDVIDEVFPLGYNKLFLFFLCTLHLNKPI